MWRLPPLRPIVGNDPTEPRAETVRAAGGRRVGAVLASAAVLASLGLTPAAAAVTTWDAPRDVGAGPALAAGSAGAVAAASRANPLPFVLPPTSVLRASKKKVWANWVVSLPRSMDNKAPSADYYAVNYLNPDGEAGKHRAYGGFLRDRPLGRDPLPGNWRLSDMEAEVRQAISAGIDGFTLVVYSLTSSPSDPGSQNWQNALLMLQAASNVDPGFKILIEPDMVSLNAQSAENLGRNLAILGRYPSAYRVDGKVVIAPFAAERHDPAWWSGLASTMASTHGVPVSWFPVFVDMSRRSTYASTSIGLSNWGSRNPLANDPDTTTTASPRGVIADAHAQGKLWMQPVSLQDERPRSGIYNEARNTENLRNTWKIAVAGGADWAHLLTWNDLPETSGMLPSLMHGWSYLDIVTYYTTWFKTGVAPVITQDTLYLTHRKQPYSARPSYPQTLLQNVTGATPPRDAIEALAFLTAPGTVKVSVGSASYTCQLPAGVNPCTVPFGTGRVSSSVTRNGVVTTGVTSPYSITSTPYVQDLQYVATSSGRDPSDGTNGSTPAPPAPTPSTTVRTLAPVADTYADQGAPGTSFAASSQMVSRGNTGAAAYLRFDVPAAPTGTRVTDVRLALRTTTSPEAGSNDVHSIWLTSSPSWSESSVSWNARPAVSSTRVGVLAAGTRPDSAVSALLSTSSVIAGGPLSLAITSTGSDNLRLWTTGHASPGMHPQLVVTYAAG